MSFWKERSCLLWKYLNSEHADEMGRLFSMSILYAPYLTQR